MALLKQTAKALSKHAPTILTIAGVAGVVSTAIAAHKAAWIYAQNEALYTRTHPSAPLLSRKERVKKYWKTYLPTAAIGLASCGCIIAANKVNLKRNAALAGLYAISETAFKEYRHKIVETLGENKERKVRDDIRTDHLSAGATNSIIYTGRGKTLCRDELNNREFESDIETIRKIINDLNIQLRRDDFVSLNDLYYALGLDESKLGGLMGWSLDCCSEIEYEFTSALNSRNEPVLVLDFKTYPKYL